MISSLAKPSPHGLRIEKPRPRPLHGVIVHQTGTGVLKHDDPLDFVLELYSRRPNAFGHYVISGSGEIWACADEDVRAWHAGIDRHDRAKYLSGTWRRRVGSAVRDAWVGDFPVWGNPVSMVPEGDPNGAYLGVELIPRSDRRFFPAQYDALARLIWDVWQRYPLPPYRPWAGPPTLGHWRQMRRQGRLLGHEDVEPLARTTRKHGGWDPGALGRDDPLFLWARLWQMLEDLAEAG